MNFVKLFTLIHLKCDRAQIFDRPGVAGAVLQTALLLTYVALSYPGSMKFQQRLGPFHMDWRITMHANVVLTIFQECLYMYYSWKIVRKPFACMVILQSMWTGP